VTVCIPNEVNPSPIAGPIQCVYLSMRTPKILKPPYGQPHYQKDRTRSSNTVSQRAFNLAAYLRSPSSLFDTSSTLSNLERPDSHLAQNSPQQQRNTQQFRLRSIGMINPLDQFCPRNRKRKRVPHDLHIFVNRGRSDKTGSQF